MTQSDVLARLQARGGRLQYERQQDSLQDSGRLQLTLPEGAPPPTEDDRDWLLRLKGALGERLGQSPRAVHIATLTASQLAIVRASAMEPDSARFNVLFHGLTSSELDADAVVRLLQRLPELAPALFFRIGWVGSAAFQFGPVDGAAWLHTRHGPPVSMDVARAEAAALARTPFDIAREPSVRALVRPVVGGHHSLVVVVHHAFCDLNTFGSVIERLEKAWSSDLRAEVVSLSAGDVAESVAMANAAAVHDAVTKEAYWADRLSRHPDCLLAEFPTVAGAQEVQSAMSFFGEERESWRAVAARLRTTPFGLTCAVLGECLLALTDRSAVLFSAVSDGLAPEQPPPAGGSFADMAPVLVSRPSEADPLQATAREVSDSLRNKVPAVQFLAQARACLRSSAVDLLPVNIVWHQQTRAQRRAFERMFSRVETLCEQVGPVAPVVLEVTDDRAALHFRVRRATAAGSRGFAERLSHQLFQRLRDVAGLQYP